MPCCDNEAFYPLLIGGLGIGMASGTGISLGHEEADFPVGHNHQVHVTGKTNRAVFHLIIRGAAVGSLLGIEVTKESASPPSLGIGNLEKSVQTGRCC